MMSMTYPGLLPDEGIDRLRAALTSANYTSEGIAERLGPEATAATNRNDFRAALKATEDRDPLATLIRVFVCGQTEPAAAVARAFKDLHLDDATSAGLVERRSSGVAAGIDLEPYGDNWWILADLPGGTRESEAGARDSDPPRGTGESDSARQIHLPAATRRQKPLPADHVLGVGGASTTLANAVIRDRVGTALDLGTGCGVQALHLSTHADRVTATDVSDRALRFASTAARLAGLEWDLRLGDMIEPLKNRRFDLVVSNPPFVVGPGTMTHTYRDSGRPGDAISAELAAASPRILNPGGTLQFLANWLHVTGEDWADRVAGWFAGTGMDVWVIQREISDPMAYVDLWLNDAGEAGDPHRAAAWLDWFDAHKVEAVGFGLVTAKNTQDPDPLVRVETLRQPLAHPFGSEVKAWFQRQDWLRDQPTLDALLGARYVAAPGLTLHQEAGLGADGWDVTHQSFVQTQGLGWSEEIDPVILALVGGCNGSVTMAEQLAVLAAAYETPEATMRGMAGVIIPHLVERAFIEPAR
jgi:methylase of polypeptide subunit release factors